MQLERERDQLLKLAGDLRVYNTVPKQIPSAGPAFEQQLESGHERDDEIDELQRWFSHNQQQLQEFMSSQKQETKVESEHVEVLLHEDLSSEKRRKVHEPTEEIIEQLIRFGGPTVQVRQRNKSIEEKRQKLATLKKQYVNM